MSEAWFQDPKDEAKIINMVAWIKGIPDPFDMKMKIAERWGHDDAMSWMGAEAIKREGIRAKLFKKEVANV
jgi:hypothetical protein